MKYMYLGQLLDGPEALQCTSRGVEVLQAAVIAAQTAGQAEEADELSQELCGGLCSLAEMRMEAAADGDAGAVAVAVEVEALLQRVSEL